MAAIRSAFFLSLPSWSTDFCVDLASDKASVHKKIFVSESEQNACDFAGTGTHAQLFQLAFQLGVLLLE
jgi:hypothetical protein